MDIEWKPNVPIQLSLELVRVCSERKGVSIWKTPSDQFLPMFPHQFEEMLKSPLFHEGKITGMFDVVKEGRSFGLRLREDL